MATKKEYEWSAEKMACVATYRVLEGEEFMDQFEDSDHPFEEAGDLEMKRLRYYPMTTTNPTILKLLSLQMAQRFYTDIEKTFTARRETDATTVGQTIRDLADVFKRKDGTLVELAEIIDDGLHFPGEQDEQG